MKLDERVRGRAATLIDKGNQLLETHYQEPRTSGGPTLDVRLYATWSSQSLTFLTDLLGPQHTYTDYFRDSMENPAHTRGTEAGIGVLQAVAEDVDRGYIATIRQLIAAEMFADLFAQSSHLLENGYKAPAASLAGAVFENGLCAIGDKNGVGVTSKDNLSALDDKLANKGLYNRLVQKRIRVWIDIRNAADHGHFDDFNKNDVSEFIKGAQSLLSELL